MSAIEALQYLADYCYKHDVGCDLEMGLSMLSELGDNITYGTVSDWVKNNV